MSETKLKKTNTVNEKKEERENPSVFMKSLFGGVDLDLCLALIKVSLVDIAKQYMWESEIPDKEKARRALVAFGSCVEYENNVPYHTSHFNISGTVLCIFLYQISLDEKQRRLFSYWSKAAQLLNSFNLLRSAVL